MANELEELYSSINGANKQLQTFQSVLAKNTSSTNILDDSFKTVATATRASKEAQEQMSKAISGTVSGLTSFSKSLIDGKGSFTPLTSVISLTTKALGGLLGKIPIVGGALKGLTEGAGQVANMMVEQFDKAYGTFEKLSDSGVVTSFEDMKTSARSMGLTMADQEGLLVKRSKELALFGGSAVRGREEFQKMAVASGDLREKFQKLGVNNQDFADMQMSYLNREMQSGRGQKATTDQLIQGSAEYIKELDSISKLTGASRKDIQAEREARMSDARYRAGVATLPKEIRDQADKFLDLTIKSGAKGIGEAFGGLIASNGKATTEEQRNFLASMQGSGMDVQKTIEGIRKGEITAEQAFDMMTAAAAKNKDRLQELTSIKGTETSITKNYVEFANLALKNGKSTKEIDEEWAAKQKKIMDDEASENAKLARAKQALVNSSINIEQMATEGKLVTGAMKFMSEGIETITEKLYTMAGEDLPPYLKAKSDERKAIEKVKDAEEKLLKIEQNQEEDPSYDFGMGQAGLGGMGLNMNEKTADARRKLEEAIEAKEKAIRTVEKENEKAGITNTKGPQNFGGSQQSDSGGVKNGGQPIDISSDYSGLNIGGNPKGEAIQGGAASKKIIDLARSFQGMYPGGVFSAFNDSFHKSGKHKDGLAFDYSLPNIRKGEKIPPQMGKQIVSQLQSMGASLAIDEYNNPSSSATGGHIHAQVSARTGGIFSGPDSGYLATLHGDEAIVDLHENSVQQQALNTSMIGGIGDKKTDFKEVYKDMESKMDRLIDIMDINVGNQRKQLKEKMS